jgi:NADH-quinone oxidoreductase subunit A
VGEVTPIITVSGVEPAFDLSQYYPIFIYAVFVLAFAVGSLAAPTSLTSAKIPPSSSCLRVGLGPHRLGPDAVRHQVLSDCHCFLIFDVELLFLYPWAAIAYREGVDSVWRAEFGRLVFWEVMVFLGTLIVAYIYVWRKGVFKWR